MINVSSDNGIAVVSFADCQALTLHDANFGRALRDAIRDAADDDDVKAILLRAEGPDFCPRATPAQLDAASRRREREHWNAWREVYASATGLYQNIAFCRKVVLTAASGHCSAAGSLLALCSGLAIATPDTVFESPFATLPEANFVLAALTMRLNRAKAWVVRGHDLSAADADAAGLVNRVVAKESLMEFALGMARSVTAMPLDGIAISKIVLESYLDSQGVGREFDVASFYASGLTAAEAHSPGRSE